MKSKFQLRITYLSKKIMHLLTIELLTRPLSKNSLSNIIEQGCNITLKVIHRYMTSALSTKSLIQLFCKAFVKVTFNKLGF